MSDIGENRGVTGEVKIMFAIPTDDPVKWRMKNAKITYRSGHVVAVDVEDGYVPRFDDKLGLTVTYYIFRAIKPENGRLTGDVTMMTCVNGRVIDANEVASEVEVAHTPDIAAALAGISQTSSELVPTAS